ncbi:SGNH/GDSL hydrolase family protein [Oculatella sp. LEGE 06141]
MAELFAFGDSLVDTGNLFAATIGLVPPSPPYFDGRFSNGPLAVERLAAQLGLPLSDRTNFAVGGARTDRTNNLDNPLLKPGGLLDQLDRFTSQAAELGAGAEDLYFIWAGGNDFLNQPTDPGAAVNAAVNNIATVVSTLAQAGARNIVVAKTPNLGRTPRSLEAGLLQPLTVLSTTFNAALESTLTQLEATFPGTNVILTDLFSLGESIAQDPSAFGFSNTTSPFLNGLTPADPAADPNQFFFWDEVHPTARSHSLFANAFRSSVISGITDDVTRIGTLEDDRLVGFSGNDRLSGRGGSDFLQGNAGNDVLLGGEQADTLVGGGGRDDLTGAEGADLLRGGLGRDRFLYGNPNHGRDIIADFQIGQDLIDLTTIFNKPEYGDSNRFAAYIRVAQVSEGAVVRIDANGDIAGGFKPLAVLSNISAGDLTAASFLVA